MPKGREKEIENERVKSKGRHEEMELRTKV